MPQEVFGFLADFENAPQWQKGVVRSALVTPGPVRLGSRFEEDVKIALWTVQAKCEITAYEAPNRLAFRTDTSGPIEYEGHFRLEPIQDGTRVTIDATAQLKGLWKLVQPFFAMDAAKETRAELQALKSVLEGAANGGAEPATA